jgi:hypothetical protein
VTAEDLLHTPFFNTTQATMKCLGFVNVLSIDPVEIVTPVIKAAAGCTAIIEKFWRVIDANFELRSDTSCGLHVHISSAEARFDIKQLRRIAQAVAVWERHVAFCTPPSRDDQAQNFCLSNLKGSAPIARDLLRYGPIKGPKHAIRNLRKMNSCDEIVDYVCPDKHRAFNLLPSRQYGHGSVEFRRPPGVVDVKKALHWIAFTMAFMNMALKQDVSRMVRQMKLNSQHRRRVAVEFHDLLRLSADELGVFKLLETELRQKDDLVALHITTMARDALQYLQNQDPAYHLSHMA